MPLPPFVAHHWPTAPAALAIVFALGTWRLGVDNFIKYSLPVLTVISMVFCGGVLAFVPNKPDVVMIGLSTVIAIGIAVLVIFVGVAANWTTALLWGVACFSCGAVLGLVFGIPPLAKTPAEASAPAPKAVTAPANAALASPAANANAAEASPATAPAAASTPAAAAATPAPAEPASTAAGSATATAAGKTAQPAAPGSTYGVNTNLTDISDWLTKIIVGVGLVQLGKIRGLLRDASRFVSVGLASGVNGKQPADFAAIALGILLYFTAIGFLSSYLLTRVWLPNALNHAA
jgi:hypothetical protein